MRQSLINNYPHISQNDSFSFEKQPDPQDRRLQRCLRLKTNESIQQKKTFNEQDRKQIKRSMINRQNQEQHHKKLIHEEYQMKIESIIKQYQLRLNKQQQFFQLKEWKLKEQLQNLENQNNSLIQEIKRLKNGTKNQQNQCSLCSNGQILSHLTKVLHETEQNHKGCLQQKKQLRQKLEQSTSKLYIIQNQHEKVYKQLRNLNKQYRSLQNKLQFTQQQKQQLQNTLKQNQKYWQSKFNQTQIQNNLRKNNLQTKNYQLVQEKTIHTPLHNIQNNTKDCSLKNSTIHHDKQLYKQNVSRGRSHISKFDNSKYINQQQSNTKSIIRKLSQHQQTHTNYGYRGQKNNWKFF